MSYAKRLTSNAVGTKLAKARKADLEDKAAPFDHVAHSYKTVSDTKISLVKLRKKYGDLIEEIYEKEILEFSDIYVLGKKTKDSLIQVCLNHNSRKVQVGGVTIRMIIDDDDKEVYPDELTWARFCALTAVISMERGDLMYGGISALLANVELPIYQKWFANFGVPGAGYLPKYYMDINDTRMASAAYVMCYVLDYAHFCIYTKEPLDSFRDFLIRMADGSIEMEGVVKAMIRQDPEMHQGVALDHALRSFIEQTKFYEKSVTSKISVPAAVRGFLELIDADDDGETGERDGYESDGGEPEGPSKDEDARAELERLRKEKEERERAERGVKGSAKKGAKALLGGKDEGRTPEFKKSK